MRGAALAWARFAVSAWVGAAILYVVTSVREVTDPRVDSVVRDVLVTIRFPAYYAAGALLLGSAWLAALVARRRWSVGLLTLALGLLIVDYFAVYQPLAALVTPPGKPRTPEFQAYHLWSEGLNGTGLLLSIVAAATLSRTAVPRSESSVA